MHHGRRSFSAALDQRLAGVDAADAADVLVGQHLHQGVQVLVGIDVMVPAALRRSAHQRDRANLTDLHQVAGSTSQAVKRVSRSRSLRGSAESVSRQRGGLPCPSRGRGAEHVPAPVSRAPGSASASRRAAPASLYGGAFGATATPRVRRAWHDAAARLQIVFLRAQDGLNHNGLFIYASETVPFVGATDVMLQGIVEANLDWRDSFRAYLIFGEDT